MKIIDRYVIRQVLLPFCLGLLVFTFVVIIPGLIEYAEEFIAKGVPFLVVVRVIVALVPQALALTIPMSLLLGLLVALGRLSADREFVAMQACGVSVSRLLRPVGLVSVVSWVATSYVLLVSVPSNNQIFREITFSIMADRAEGEVKPRIFFDDFPNLVLYVREVPAAGGGWNGVFVSDTRPGNDPATYFARHGRVLINREKRTVEMVLQHASRHSVDPSGTYKVSRFDRVLLSIDPETLFPRGGPSKGDNEMSIAELRARVAEHERSGVSTHNELMAIHRRFSIPVACLVFGLIGLALGATNRRDGTLGSFVLGLIVIFAYYVPLYLGPALAKGRLLAPWLAVWLPNVVLGLAGVALFRWRERAADRQIRIQVPSLLRTFVATGQSLGMRWSALSILDRYVVTTYTRIFALAALAMAAVFYISTFIDRSERVFKGEATWEMLASYFLFVTPQYIYYILPLSVLIAALVTVGALTKNNELVVMKACGISLYRAALPLLVCALVASALLFGLEESVLGPANRRAESVRHAMRGGATNASDHLNRRWVVANGGDFYRYDYFDPSTRRFLGLSMYELNEDMSGLVKRTFAERVSHLGRVAGASLDTWRLEKGWTREFDQLGEPEQFVTFDRTEKAFESASYFATDQPDARFMSYSQLRAYAARLGLSGFDVLALQVALARKLSFPFITLIMTLIAVPFAVSTGRVGAMAGIGIGIGLAMVYWTTISLFAAFGTGGLIAPTLAAWAPNLLFGAGAVYLLLTVRT